MSRRLVRAFPRSASEGHGPTLYVVAEGRRASRQHVPTRSVGTSAWVICILSAAFLALGCTSEESSDVAGKVATTEVLRPQSGGEMILIAGGQFTMGDPDGLADETPHEVYVDSFYMDKHTVSQELYESVMGVNPSKRKGPQNPVERVQWTDAARFCNRCSELEGLTPSYDLETWQCNFEADGYRLPTEAEWEYACRAGSQTKYFFGDDEGQLAKYAWFKPGSKGRTRPVGQKLPNPWGLYDMHGNVWQWCNDYYSEAYYVESPRENPKGPASGKKRVLRGGAWNSTAAMCRAAQRFSEFQVFTDACFGSDSYGFRRVRNAKPASPAATVVADAGSSGESQAEEPVAAEAVEGDQPPTAAEKETREAEPVATDSAEATSATTGKIDPARLTGTIVFVSDRAGPLDIWSMKANGHDLKQLTGDAHADADPRFSPSGKRILYTSMREGFPHVWIMGADGSNPERVTEGSQAAWSPDGESIIFIRDDQAYIRELATGDEKRITPQNWRRCGVPAWSPDGKQVAVASRHLERIGIFLLTTDGSEQEQLKTEYGSCTPQWSHDGSKIVFQTDRGHIHLYYTNDQFEEQVTFGADIQHDARFSPDGSMIVFSRAPTDDGPWQLWITDLASDDLDSMQITREASNRLPDWHQTEE